MTTFARGFLLATFGAALVTAAWVFWPTSEPPTPTPTEQPMAAPTPEPFEPPEPEDDDLELPTLPKIPVCHCGTAYGACVDVLMVRQAARLHGVKHDHDLIGRGCASADEEDHALWRILRRPEAIEMNGQNALAMADRSAFRERTGGAS